MHSAASRAFFARREKVGLLSLQSADIWCQTMQQQPLTIMKSTNVQRFSNNNNNNVAVDLKIIQLLEI